MNEIDFLNMLMAGREEQRRTENAPELFKLDYAIKLEPENVQNYISLANFLKHQLFYSKGLLRIKLLVELLNCYKNQIFYSKSPEFDFQLEQGDMKNVVNEIHEIQNQISNRINEQDQNQNEQNLYYDKAQNYLILAFCEFGNPQFKILFQKALQTFDEACCLNSVECKQILEKKFEFIKESLFDFNYQPNVYLEILLEGMKTQDQLIKLEGIIKVVNGKIVFLKKMLFGRYQESNLCNYDIEKIQESCQNVLNSIKQIPAVNEKEKIEVLLLKMEVFTIFVFFFSVSNKNEVQKQIYKKLAFKCNSEIQNLFQLLKGKNVTEEILLFEIHKLHQIHDNLRIVWDSQDRIKHLKQILDVWETLSEINPKNMITLKNYLHDIRQLELFQLLLELKDQDILNRECKVLFKMISVEPSEDLFNDKVRIMVNILELKKNFKEKQIVLEQGLKSYENACMQCPDSFKIFQLKIKFALEIPKLLKIYKTMNEYYQYALDSLKTFPCRKIWIVGITHRTMCINLYYMGKDFLKEILQKLNDKDFKIMIKQLNDLYDFWMKHCHNHYKSKLLKGFVLENVGDVAKENEKQQYYNGALDYYHDFSKDGQIRKANLLQKLNRNFEALTWCCTCTQGGKTFFIDQQFITLLNGYNLYRISLVAKRLYCCNEPPTSRKNLMDLI